MAQVLQLRRRSAAINADELDAGCRLSMATIGWKVSRMIRWPRWAHEMAKDGDLLMIALTNTPPCPERRMWQIIRRRACLMREWDSLGEELFDLTEALNAKSPPPPK